MKLLDAITAFSALAQETRLSAYRILVKAGPDGMTPGALADSLGVPAPTLSFHLNLLVQAGLLKRKRNSRNIIYTVEYNHMRTLLAFLVEDCCKGQTGLTLVEQEATACCAPLKEPCCDAE